MNNNGYVPILINTLGTIVSGWGGNMLSSTPLVVDYLLHTAGDFCILLML